MNCQFCGSTKDVHNITEITKGEIKGICCEKCLEEAKSCDGCGSLHIYNKTIAYVEGPNQYLCTDCSGDLQTCSRCGKLTTGNSKVGTRCVCPSCIEKDYFRCDCCKGLRLKSGHISKLDYYKFEHVLDGLDTCRRCFRTRTKGQVEKVLYECTHCNEITSLTYKVGGKELPFCEKCAKNIKSCAHCTDKFFYDGSYPLAIVNGKEICNTCKTDSFSRCRVCGNYHHKDGGVKFKRHTVCESCAINIHSCDYCEDVFMGQPHMIGKKKYCPHCAELYRPCNFCGHQGFDVEEYDTGNQSGQACLKCRTTKKLWHIKSWRHVPRRLEMTGEGDLFYGVEVELSVGAKGSVPNLCAHIAGLGNPLLYIKHDGSITNGIEVVTHPATFDKIKTLGFDKMFDHDGIKDHKSCGFHVHLSRAPFTSVHLFNFMKFFHLCQPEIEKLAGRTYELMYANGRLCKKTEEHEISAMIEGKIRDKYREVRLNCENTIEVRVFKGVTSAEEMYHNIEFCDAVFHFTKGDAPLMGGWKQFQQYVEQNKEKYPNLVAYFN